MLKKILPLFLLILIILAFFPAKHNALPENDLWKQDFLDKSVDGEEMFNKIIDTAYEIYKPISEAAGDSSLTINNKWEDSTVNANAMRLFGYAVINMYGGLARRPEITNEGFALVLCHELGHLYGGTPYLSAWRKMSAEGQADYYGAKTCLKKILKKLNLEDSELIPTEYMERTCYNIFPIQEDSDLCIQTMIGGQSLGNLLATIKEEEIPNYETPDPTIVEETLLSYPATIQCRLDTYHNGNLGLNRPACWFKD